MSKVKTETLHHGRMSLSTFNGIGAAYSFSGSGHSADDTTTTVIVDTDDKVASVVAAWGPNNDYPQKVTKAIRLNGAASSGLRFLKKSHYGNGIILTKANADDKIKEPTIIPLHKVPEIHAFFKKSQMKRFWRETISDLEDWNIGFPEYILSKDYKTINRVKRQRAAWCRFQLMGDNGLIDSVHLSQKWGTSSNLNSKFVVKIPVIDSYWSAEEVKDYCKKKKIHNFVRPIFYPLVDEAYYPKPPHLAVYENGWLDVANSIPEYKKNLFNNQISIKFLIEVHEDYFIKLYDEKWKTFTPEERITVREKLIDAINDHLAGAEKSGKSIQAMVFRDDQGKDVSAIKITPIDDKLKEGIYLPEASAANSEVLFALGVDPTLIGAGIPGGKLGAGSGSDKREAFTILSALFKTNRETTLEVFEFIQDYNGWDPEIIPAFENIVLTTLDKNPKGKQTETP